MGQEDRPIARRSLLTAIALGAGGITSFFGLSRLFSTRPRDRSRDTPLPGAGSIFQPRRDARLEEWERRRGRRES